MENILLPPDASLTLSELMFRITIAILIGLFIGIERERRKKDGTKSFAGIRTFPLISILGFIAALIASITHIGVFIAIFVVFGILVSISYYLSSKDGGYGGTSEITVLIIFTLGALTFYGFLLLAASVSIILGIFLTFKTQFRAFAGKIEEEDMYATIKFAIITLVVLPLLPNESFGPLDAFNPRKIWFMVVLIAGISFIGYVLFKLIGTKRGIQLLSILGGLASSTAVTLSFTQRSKEVVSLSRNLAAGIVLASTIMFPRVLLIIYVLNAKLANMLLLPVGIFTTAGLLTGLLLWRDKGDVDYKSINLKNPFKLFMAFKFGVVFAIILLLSKAAQTFVGDQGIYLTSIFAGFADVDAVALSIVDLVNNELALNVAVVAIILGAITNSVVKMMIAYFWGSKELGRYTIIGFSGIIISSLVYVGFLVI
ncbi:MAG: MgtC/SapB family protein [Bacteroidetes bacterium]|nr:MgtC/SapB family protein [Bacteroidota bacterium]